MATYNNQLQAQQKPKFSVAITTKGYQSLIANTLRDPARVRRFTASITSAVAVNPALQECDAGTILAGALLGESLNLSPSPQLGQYYLVPFKQFLSTPSARRATAKTETKSLFSNKLYNILHEFRRALIYNGSKNDPNHAKRLENPVRRCRKNAENSPFAPGRKTQNNSRPSCSKGG